MDGEKRKRVEQPVNEVNTGGTRLPRPETPPVRHAVIPLLSVLFPTACPDIFRERLPTWT